VQPFDPAPHESELRALISEIERAGALDVRALDRIVRRHPKRPRGLFSKSEIIAGYRSFRASDAEGEADFVARLRLRPVRTLSGVTPVTVLTRPFPCPGTCIFCPNDVRMPKSYLADEPGAQRAESNDFDPYLQTWNRLAAYRAIGHPADKVELIVLGGTWSFHPEPYQIWFVTRCLDALSDFGACVDGRAQARAEAAPADFAGLPRIDGRVMSRSYNQTLQDHLRRSHGRSLLPDSEHATWARLAKAQRRNESAGSRCVGLAVETRPDRVSEDEVLRLRRLGVTKLQLGIQSLDDGVLARSRRGHDVAATRLAVRRLRAAGFKIHAHWMANLPGATPEADVRDFARLFDDEDFRPDELKLYPCMLVESAELMGPWERGEWRPYDDEQLLRVIVPAMARTPRWCRLTRVVRDFSAHDIVAGTHTANLREVAEGRLEGQGRRCRDIRAREIRDAAFDRDSLALRATTYRTSVGDEVFLEYVREDDRLVGFLRLTLPAAPSFVSEIASSALVREVHVYGAAVRIGERAGDAPQHAGLGTRLIEEAARRAVEAGHTDLAVISAIGTRAWYRSLGFRDGPLYQHRAL
jgi:elongator complex protein 3